MKGLLIFAAVAVLIVTPLFGQQVVPVGIQANDGVYVLTISSGQVSSLVPLPIIKPSGPVPPPPPPPPPVDDLSKAVTAEINKIPATDARHAAAMKLAKTLEVLAQQAIPPDKTVSAVTTIANLALGSDAQAWSSVLAVVNSALGKCTTELACDTVLTQAAAAVTATVPTSADGDINALAEAYGFDWDKFLDFLMQLIMLLLPLFI